METFPTDQHGVETIKWKELASEDVARILTWSFYFSQGNVPLQERIFAYVAKKHPDWRIRPDSIPGSAALATTFAQKFTLQGPHTRNSLDQGPITSKMVEEEISKHLKQLTQALNKRTLPMEIKSDDGKRNTIKVALNDFWDVDLLEGLITTDAQHVFIDNRANRGALTQGPHRRYISQFVSYALAGEKVPGHAVFAEMFRDMRALLETKVAHNPAYPMLPQLNDLIKTHNEHSETKVPLFSRTNE